MYQRLEIILQLPSLDINDACIINIKHNHLSTSDLLLWQQLVEEVDRERHADHGRELEHHLMTRTC